MKIVRFKARGATIVASVRCAPRRDGSYTLRLWEKDTNAIVPPSPWDGNFINEDDDDHALPRPNRRNHQRMLQCMVVVAIPPRAGPSTVSLSVMQGELELGREDRVVPPDTVDQAVSIWLRLEEA